MPDPRPWRMTDAAAGPYPARSPRQPHAADRFLIGMAAPAAAWLAPGARQLRRRVRPVEALQPEMAALGDNSLRAAADALRPLLLAQGFIHPLVARGLAIVREAAWRHVGIRHYPVQLMGGWALIDGMLTEMATGEGKTMTAALAAGVAALAGMPVHVVTVNDYLAARDAEQLAPVYAALGLSVGCIKQDDDGPARRAAYAADVTYVTGKEVAFDYLRDRLAVRASAGRTSPLDRLLGRVDGGQLRLRGLGFALVDEADSVLIDEARTPLIIAERDPVGHSVDYAAALAMARSLVPGIDYRVLPDQRAAELTTAGRAVLAGACAELGGVWRYRRAREEVAEQALAALHLFHCDRDYILRDGKVEIVDEYTGRVAEGRQWERGLQQLIEEKEQAERSPRDLTAARITTQSFFRRYARLSGMTGTAAEHVAEFWSVYGLAVARIPTHRPVRRRRVGRALHCGTEARWDAVAEEAGRRSAAGRCVLIGTRSVAASEAVGARLEALGLAHTVLNARQDRDEAAVVAGAGFRGRITVATNMAGRGTDIKLGPGVVEAGGLHVIVTEYHDSPRIDRQLIGRAARQGDPGSWQAIVSLDDELFVLNLPRVVRRLAGAWPSGAVAELLRRSAQRTAERRHERERRAVLREERRIARSLSFAGPEVG